MKTSNLLNSKKLILSILILGIMVGYVNAIQVNFESSVQDSNEFLVKWENLGSAPGLYLQYKEGDCLSGIWNDLSGPFDGSGTEYLWDITSIDDGEYCLRLIVSSEIYDTKLFIINRTSPTEDDSEEKDLENEIVLIFSEKEDTLQKNINYEFTIKNEVYELRVEKIGEDYALIIINSKEIELSVGETKKIDVDGDGAEDISLKLISASKKEIIIEYEELETIEIIGIENQSLAKMTGEVTGTSRTSGITAMIIFIFVMIGVFVFVKIKKRAPNSQKEGNNKKHIYKDNNTFKWINSG